LATENAKQDQVSYNLAPSREIFRKRFAFSALLYFEICAACANSRKEHRRDAEHAEIGFVYLLNQTLIRPLRPLRSLR